jgi:hypothetical protein
MEVFIVSRVFGSVFAMLSAVTALGVFLGNFSVFIPLFIMSSTLQSSQALEGIVNFCPSELPIFARKFYGTAFA